MANLKSNFLQLIVDTESIFNNVIIEDKIYSDYFDPGTRFLKFKYELSMKYNFTSINSEYRNLNDRNYWNEEYRDKTNKEIVASGFEKNKTQLKIEEIKLPSDIINKLAKLEIEEFDNIKILCKLIYTKKINVGYDQLVRSSLILSNFDKVRMTELIKGNFMRDPRDVLVYAHNKSQGMNYGIELFK